jgi:Tricorn protease C1 domain
VVCAERLSLPATEERSRWKQALDDAWRTYRDRAFYPVPGWAKLKPRFEELISWAAHTTDAESVLREMLGEASQSHTILNRKDRPRGPGIGLLGVDFRIEQGFYRIAKIYGRAEGRCEGYRTAGNARHRREGGRLPHCGSRPASQRKHGDLCGVSGDERRRSNAAGESSSLGSRSARDRCEDPARRIQAALRRGG